MDMPGFQLAFNSSPPATTTPPYYTLRATADRAELPHHATNAEKYFDAIHFFISTPLRHARLGCFESRCHSQRRHHAASIYHLLEKAPPRAYL